MRTTYRTFLVSLGLTSLFFQTYQSLAQNFPAADPSDITFKIARETKELSALLSEQGDTTQALNLAHQIQMDLNKSVSVNGQIEKASAFLKENNPSLLTTSTRTDKVGLRYGEGQVVNLGEMRSVNKLYDALPLESSYSPTNSRAEISDPYIRCYSSMQPASAYATRIFDSKTGVIDAGGTSGPLVLPSKREGKDGYYVFFGKDKYLFVDSKQLAEKSCLENSGGESLLAFNLTNSPDGFKFCRISRFNSNEDLVSGCSKSPAHKNSGLPTKMTGSSCTYDVAQAQTMDKAASYARQQGTLTLIRKAIPSFQEQIDFNRNMIARQTPQSFQKEKDSLQKANPQSMINYLKGCATIDDDKIKTELKTRIAILNSWPKDGSVVVSPPSPEAATGAQEVEK